MQSPSLEKIRLACVAWQLRRRQLAATEVSGAGLRSTTNKRQHSFARAQPELAAGLLEAIVDSSDDAIIGIDLEAIITSWNAGAEAIFGYPASEALGTSIMRLLPEDRRSEMNEILERIKRDERVKHYDTLRITKDGRLIDVSVTASPIKNSRGEVVGASKVARDITEAKQMAKALGTSEMRYRRLFETSKDGILVLDADTGVVVDVNAFLMTLLGYSYQELVGRTIWELGLFKDIVANAEHFLELKAKGYLRYDDLPLLAANGAPIEVEFVSNVYLVDGGKVIQCSVRDVTERRRMEQALRASAEHFRLLNDLAEATQALMGTAQIMAVTAQMLAERLHVSHCSYATVSEDGHHVTIVHDYNVGSASTVGQYELAKFGTRTVNGLRRGHNLIIRNVAAELAGSEEAQAFRDMSIGAVIVCPLITEGRLRGLMSVHQVEPRDWTSSEIAMLQDFAQRCWSAIETRAAEDTIQRLNVELEQRVLDRTSELETANRELEAFSYSVSHDLRAPLRAVDGFAQALIEDYGPQLPEDGQRYLQTIRAGTRSMGALIDDLLTFSRLGRAPLSKHSVNTAQQVATVINELRQTVGKRKIDWRISQLPASSGDAALLKQVWINLISNALKFTRERENTVIEVGCRSGPEGNVYFVRDNGTGFDMRYANKLFGVFQRLHRAEDYEGTGVGLAIVQRVIHRHGGRIWADATLGVGATFFFTLE